MQHKNKQRRNSKIKAKHEQPIDYGHGGKYVYIAASQTSVRYMRCMRRRRYTEDEGPTVNNARQPRATGWRWHHRITRPQRKNLKPKADKMLSRPKNETMPLPRPCDRLSLIRRPRLAWALRPPAPSVPVTRDGDPKITPIYHTPDITYHSEV